MEQHQYKENLIIQISELFLRYGLRSTSMDDIARHLKISKKTLYQYFKNKEDVVEQIMLYRRYKRDQDTSPEILKGKNPIELLSDIKFFMLRDIHNRYPSNFYDLKKYYPGVYKKLHMEDDEFVQRFLDFLIKEGLTRNLFREDVDMEMQLYLFSRQLQFLREPDNLFGNKYPLSRIISTIIDNFLAVTGTQKGLEEYERLQLLNKQNINNLP